MTGLVFAILFGMASGITARIERELGMAGVLTALANLPASDLRSLLIEVCGIRAAEVKESGILAQMRRDPLSRPSAVDARTLAAFDSIAFECASGFEALDLSPVCPFGASRLLGATSQNNLLTTIRNAEVLGDCTIAMALEASMRRTRSHHTVRLCASHRVIRLQPFDVPGFSPHFRLFGLVTAGRDSGSWRFETTHLLEHLRVYLRMFRSLNAAGFSIRDPLIELTDMAGVETQLTAAGIAREEIHAAIAAHRLGGSERFLRDRGVELSPAAAHPLLESQVLEPLRAEFPEAEFRTAQNRLEGLGYYSSFALRISPVAPDGNRYPVADGGFTRWTARLLNNRKERLLISGIGAEFLCKKYRP